MLRKHHTTGGTACWEPRSLRTLAVPKSSREVYIVVHTEALPKRPCDEGKSDNSMDGAKCLETQNPAYLHEETDAQDLQWERQVNEEAQAVVIRPQHTARQRAYHQHVQHGAEKQKLDAVGQQRKACVSDWSARKPELNTVIVRSCWL